MSYRADFDRKLDRFRTLRRPVMSEIGTITMSMREVDRLKVIEALADGRLMPWRAAEPAATWRTVAAI
jgi:hypothetical protein